jgi:CheY-like chemotaxis protein
MQPGEYVVLSVKDTGVGMSTEVKARIFEPFFTTKELGRGTGLGLATVYGIVKQSGGFICVYSEVDRGTNFKIYLPRASAQAILKVRPDRTKALPRGSETILLVEDEMRVRELASSMLRRQGYRVLEAADGDEALNMAQLLTNSIDLLVTDVILPKLNGPKLAAKLKVTRPDLKILYVSGYADEMIARLGVLEPGVPLLTKPFSARLLAQKVRQVLEASANNHTHNAA